MWSQPGPWEDEEAAGRWRGWEERVSKWTVGLHTSGVKPGESNAKRRGLQSLPFNSQQERDSAAALQSMGLFFPLCLRLLIQQWKRTVVLKHNLLWKGQNLSQNISPEQPLRYLPTITLYHRHLPGLFQWSDQFKGWEQTSVAWSR